MSPEEKFLKSNSQMFFCAKYKCSLTYSECVKRQKALKESHSSMSGIALRRGGRSLDYSHCLKCKEGLENRKKLKNGNGGIMPTTKTCPCGKTIIRPEGMNNKSWAKTRYCEEHRVMTLQARKKDIEQILEDRLIDKITNGGVSDRQIKTLKTLANNGKVKFFKTTGNQPDSGE